MSSAAKVAKRISTRYSRFKKVLAPARIKPPTRSIFSLPPGCRLTHKYSHAA